VPCGGGQRAVWRRTACRAVAAGLSREPGEKGRAGIGQGGAGPHGQRKPGEQVWRGRTTVACDGGVCACVAIGSTREKGRVERKWAGGVKDRPRTPWSFHMAVLTRTRAGWVSWHATGDKVVNVYAFSLSRAKYVAPPGRVLFYEEPTGMMRKG
jgi:hypothetical protein